MPSFLSKVFGRKKDDKDSPRRVADTGLLDGKFEAVSPSATKFPEVANERQTRHKEKESPFNVFRSKSRPSSPESKKDRRGEVPHLSLDLPGLRDEEASRELGLVFDADPESQVLSEDVIGRRRLSPLETLVLVRACSEAIIARGLESLGIMHPHWYSASPEEQRKLISLFLKSLAPKDSIITLSTTPSAIATVFNSEISSTQSPYDVAAVLRWGLRHLQLEGTSFGKDDNWYKAFFDAERSAGWPPNGYSSTLAPLLPTSHLELLTATLELFSSLAAHAEANGISGSKLSKFFGLWLLTVERVHKDDDWSTFYTRWERTGRMLEHLFLSRIRDDATEARMPTRLLELIQRYPYQTGPDTDLLVRPRFSTIIHDALFVRIETELSATADQPSHHPLRIISEAFKAEASFDAGEHTNLWESIRKSGAIGNGGSPSACEYPGLSHIFADETLRFFSLVPMDMGSSAVGSTSFNLFTRPSLPGSSSLGDKDAAGSSPPKHSKTPTSPIPPSDLNSPIGPDWITFSTSGFLGDASEQPPLASTLMEKERDMEVTIPRPSSPRLSLFNSRKSSDRPRTPAKSEVPRPVPLSAVLSPIKSVSKSTHVALVQLDEAFIDFWSDALLDPISSSWPAFVICKLKNIEAEVDGKRIQWLVVEQAFKRPPPPMPETSTSSHSHESSSSRARTSSPKSTTTTSDSSFMFSSMLKKKFGFLSSPAKSATPLPQYKEGTKGKGKGKKKVAGPVVGEMGEIMREEGEGGSGKTEKGKKNETVRVMVPSPKPKKSVEASRQSVIVAVKKSIDEGSRTNSVVAGSLAAGAAVAVGAAAVTVAAGASQVNKAEEPAFALAVDSTTSGAPVDVASVIPQQVPIPEPVKEVETVNEPAIAQNEVPSTVAAAVVEPKVFLMADSVQGEAPARQLVVSEPEAAQTAVQQANAAEAEVVSVSETMKEPQAEVVPAVEETKIPEHKAAPDDAASEAVPVVEETKVLEPQAPPVEEEAKVPKPQVASAVEEAKAHETVVEETKSPEPEFVKEAKVPEDIAASIDDVKTRARELEVTLEEIKAPERVEEVKAAESVVEEAKVSAPVVEEEVKDAKPEVVVPVVEEAKIPEPEVVPHNTEIKTFEPDVVSTTNEAKTRELEVVPIAEEIKAPERVEEVKAAESVVEEAKISAPVVEEVKVPGPVHDAKLPEPEVVVPVVEEAKVPEPEVVPHNAEIKTFEPDVVSTTNEAKTRELEVVPIAEEVKAPEHVEEVKAAESVVEEVKVPGPVHDAKLPEPEVVVPVVEEAKVPEPEVVPFNAEINTFEPDVVSTINEVKTREPEVAPIAEEIKAPEREAAPVVETKPDEVTPVMEEANALEGVPSVKEAKVLEHEVAPPFEEEKACELEIAPAIDEVKSRELEVTPIVEETKVPEDKVVPAVQENKMAGTEAASVVKETEASGLEVGPTVDEIKVPEPEVVPFVEETEALKPEVKPEAVEVQPMEREVASTVSQTKMPGTAMGETVTEPESIPIVGEGQTSAIFQTQEEVANETMTKDLHDEHPQLEPETIIPAKAILAEPVAEAEVPQSRTEEYQIPVRAFQPEAEVLPMEEKFEPVVGKVVEPVAEDIVKPGGEGTNQSVAAEVNEPIVQVTTESVDKPLVEGTTKVTEPVVGEAVPPVVTEAHEDIVQTAEPVVEKTVETAEEPSIEELVQPLVSEPRQPIVEEPVEPVKQHVIEVPFQPLVPESQPPSVEGPLEPAKQPVVEERAESATQPVVEEVTPTLVEETHERAETAVPVARVPPVIEITEPEPVFDKNATDDKVADPLKSVANEEVPVKEHVEDALVEGGSVPAEAVLIKEEASREMPIAEDVKTSVEEVPAAVAAIGEAPIVESVAEKPLSAAVEEVKSPVTKESTEVSTGTITEVVIPTSEEVKENPVLTAPVPENDVEDVSAPTIKVAPVVEQPGILVSDSVAAPTPVEVVAKEESATAEPDIVKAKEETSPQAAFEAVETHQEGVVKDTIPSKSEPAPLIVESSIERTLEPVTLPAEHAPVVEEPVAAVIENASVVGLEKGDAPATDGAVSEDSAPVVTHSAGPVEEFEVTAVEELEAERFVPVKAEPSSTASDIPAAGSTATVELGNAAAKETVVEEPAPSATRSENAAEPTEQASTPAPEEAVTPDMGEHEHTVSVAEPEHQLEMRAPAESTDAVQEEMSVHAQTKEVAPAVEKSTSTTVESEVEAEHETSKESLTGIEEFTRSAAAEPESGVQTLQAEPVPTTANQIIEDSTPIVKESALSVPAEFAPVAEDQPAESTDVVGPGNETPVPRTEVAPTIKEPALSAAEPETRAVATEAEDAPVPATEEVSSINEGFTPSVKALAVPAEAEAVPGDTGHSAKESADIANTEPPAPISIEKEVVPIVDQPQVGANLAAMEVQPMSTKNVSERTPVSVLEAPVIEEPAPANVVELESTPKIHHPSASAAADGPVEESIAVGNSTEASATEVAPIVKEPESSPSAAAETKSIPVAQDELNQESTLVTHASDETSMPAAEGVIVNVAKEPIAEEPTPSATESQAQAQAQAEAPAHANTEPTTTEEKAPIVDSKEEIPAPIVEAAPEHLEPKQAPVPPKVDAPAIAEEPTQKPILIKSATDTSVPITEGATSISEEPTTSVDREVAAFDNVVPSKTTDEPMNESSTIAFESLAASVPVTEDSPAPLADEVKPLVVESEPAHVTVKPVPTVTGESAKESVPIAEHAPNAEVSDKEVPIVKEDTVSVEATIVKENPAKIEVTPAVQDTTESSNSIHETTNRSVSKDDAIVVAENGNGHSAAAKEEEEPAKTAVSAEVPDISAAASAKD